MEFVYVFNSGCFDEVVCFIEVVILCVFEVGLDFVWWFFEGLWVVFLYNFFGDLDCVFVMVDVGFVDLCCVYVVVVEVYWMMI